MTTLRKTIVLGIIALLLAYSRAQALDNQLALTNAALVVGDDGKPRTDHRHAHIFCEANGPRDAITHITIWAPMEFDEGACLALRRLTKVWGYGGHRRVIKGIRAWHNSCVAAGR